MELFKQKANTVFICIQNTNYSKFITAKALTNHIQLLPPEHVVCRPFHLALPCLI